MKERISNSVEQIENPLENALKTLLLEAQTINHGNNGIIKRVGMGELPLELVEHLERTCSYCPEIDKIVFKMIKIYTGGRGKAEFDEQKRAYEIIEIARRDKKDKKKYASVPRPYLYLEMKADENIKEMLGRDNLNANQEKIEVLLMDFIDGEDLAVKLFKEVLKNHPNARFLKKEDIDEMAIEELHNHAALCLDFKNPGGKSRDEGEREYESGVVRSENAQQVVNFLKNVGEKKKKPVLKKEILEEVENTIGLFHNNNFYHRDLHERNIMITKKGSFIIDYDKAKVNDTKEGRAEVYTENDNRLVDDKSVVIRYKPLTILEEERRNHSLFVQEEGIKNIYNNTDFIATINQGIKKASLENINTMSDQMAQKFFSYGSELYYDAKLIAITEFFETINEADRKEQLKEFIKNLNVPQFFKNKAVKYLVSRFNLI